MAIKDYIYPKINKIMNYSFSLMPSQDQPITVLKTMMQNITDNSLQCKWSVSIGYALTKSQHHK